MSLLNVTKKMTAMEIKKALVKHFSSKDSYFIRQDRLAIEVLLPYRNITVEEVTMAMSKEFRALVTVYPVEYGAGLIMVTDIVTHEASRLRGVRINIRR